MKTDEQHFFDLLQIDSSIKKSQLYNMLEKKWPMLFDVRTTSKQSKVVIPGQKLPDIYTGVVKYD